jgi:hypothetical protein
MGLSTGAMNRENADYLGDMGTTNGNPGMGADNPLFPSTSLQTNQSPPSLTTLHPQTYMEMSGNDFGVYGNVDSLSGEDKLITLLGLAVLTASRGGSCCRRVGRSSSRRGHRVTGGVPQR